MKLSDAIKDTNKSLITFLAHDHWELKYSFSLIKDGFLEISSGIYYLLRWGFALLSIPFIPILYPIAVIIRLIK